MKSIIPPIILILLPIWAFSQQYPVELIVIQKKNQISTLHELGNTLDPIFEIGLRLDDLQTHRRDCHIIWEITTSDGKTLSNNLQPFEVTLEPGIYKHISHQSTMVGSTLPISYAEGIYEIEFQVIEKYSGATLSIPHKSQFSVFYPLPAEIIEPSHNFSIDESQATLNVSWSQVQPFGTIPKYRLEMIPYSQGSLSPAELFLYSPKLFESEETGNNLLINLNELNLQPGQKYALRVTTSSSDQTVFKNGGYSSIIVFDIKYTCNTPEDISLIKVKTNSLEYLAEESFRTTGLEVQYSLKEEEESHIATFSNTRFELSNLEAGTTVKLRARAICHSNKSSWSNWIHQTTLDHSESTFTCSIQPHNLIDDKTPVTTKPGSEVIFNKLILKIIDFNENEGPYYSGTGLLRLPFLKKAILLVSFSELSINKDQIAFHGEIEIIGIRHEYYDQIQEITTKTDSIVQQWNQNLEITSAISDSIQYYFGKETQTDEAESTETETDTLYSNKSVDSTASEKAQNISEKPAQEADSTHQNQSKENTTTVANTISDTPYFGTVTIVENKIKPFQLGDLFYDFEESTIEKGSAKITVSGKVTTSIFLFGRPTQLSLEGLISLTIDTATIPNKIKEIHFHSQTNQQLIGPYFLDYKVESMEWTQRDNGLIDAYAQFSPLFKKQVFFSNLDFADASISGKITFEASQSNKLEGVLYAEDMNASNILWLKDPTNPINLVFSKNGLAQKTLNLENVQQGEYLEIVEAKLLLKFDIRSEIKVSPVELKGHITNLPYFTDFIPFDSKIESWSEGITLTPTQVDFFGSQVLNSSLKLFLDDRWEIQSVQGMFTMRNPHFSGEIRIDNYYFSKDSLEVKASGEIHRNGLDIAISRSRIENSILYMDGIVEYVENENKIAAELKDLGITRTGELLMGNYTVAGNVSLTFGDFTFLLKSKPTHSRVEGEYKVFSRLKGTLIKTINQGGESKEIKILDSFLSYEIDQNGNWRNAEVEASGLHYPFFQYGYFDTYIKGIVLKVKSSEQPIAHLKLSLSGKLSNEFFFYSNGNSGLQYYINDGATAYFDFNLRENNGEITSTWDLVKLNNLDIRVKKNGRSFCSIENFSMDSTNLVKARLKAQADVVIPSNQGSLTFDELFLDIKVDASRPDWKVSIVKGKGRIKVHDLPGMSGRMVFELQIDRESILTRLLDNYSEIRFQNLNVNDLKLSLLMSHEFDIKKIYGSFALKHPDLHQSLTVEEFLMEEREIKKCIIGPTKLNYRKFEFEVTNAHYEKDKFLLSASYLLRLKEGAGVKVKVDTFGITSKGEVLIGRINGGFQMSPIDISFQADFDKHRFKGHFKGSLTEKLNIDGEIDLGIKDDYQFGYLHLVSSANIPISPAFKISKLGGTVGVNYELNYNKETYNFQGNPRKGNYVAGLGLGISDQTESLEIFGNPILQFGSGDTRLAMRGYLSIPKSKPLYHGDLNIVYNITQSDFKGSLVSDISVPHYSGEIIKGSNLTLEFAADESGISLRGHNLKATVLKYLELTGSVSIIQTRNQTIRGQLSGQVIFDFQHEIKEELAVGEIKGGIGLTFQSYAQFTLSNTDISGELSSGISGIAYLEFSNSFLGTTSISTSFDGNASIQRYNSVTNLQGDLSFRFHAMGSNISFSDQLSIQL